MAKRPITVHTLESIQSRCEEVGDCWEWQGYYATGNKVPYVSNDGKMVAVRKIVAALSGRDVSKASNWGTRCGNWRCVCPDHVVGRTDRQHSQHMAGLVNHQAPARIARMQQVARGRAVCKLDLDQVEAIRLDPRPVGAIGQAFGISKSQAARIKSGKAWKQVTASANPWGGLMR